MRHGYEFLSPGERAASDFELVLLLAVLALLAHVGLAGLGPVLVLPARRVRAVGEEGGSRAGSCEG